MVKTLLSFLLLFSFVLNFCQKAEAGNVISNNEIAFSSPYYSDFSPEQNKFVTKYYPNPATNYITFEFDKKVESNSRLLIYSFTGRKMNEIQIANIKITVNLSDYFRGLYMFQLISSKGVIEESGKFQVIK